MNASFHDELNLIKIAFVIMASSTVTFPSIECPPLLVRRFSVQEALSKPFEISVRTSS